MNVGTEMIFLTVLVNAFYNSADAKLKTPNGNGYILGCYYTNWAQYRHGKGQYMPEKYFPGLCTHIFYAFATMDDNFSIKPFEWNDETTDYSKGMYERVNAMKKLQPGLKTLLSFGGWTFSERNKSLLKAMASSKTNRQTFILSALNFTKKHNFDGFDLDWEYPGQDEKPNFTKLVQEMYAVFHANGLLLTAAVPAAIPKIDAGYEVREIAKSVDFVNVMTYDIHGSWESFTGFNSPLFDRNGDKLSMATGAKYWWSKGMPKEKIILGFATYGRSWTLLGTKYVDSVGAPATVAKAGVYTQEPGFLAYYEICELSDNGGTRYFDHMQKVPYMVHDHQWVGYDDAESFKIKIKWLKENNYGGAFVWTLDLDDFNGICSSSKPVKYPLIRTIYDELSKSAAPARTTVDYVSSGSSTPSVLAGLWTSNPRTSTGATTRAVPNIVRPPVGVDSLSRRPFHCPSSGLFPDPHSCVHFYSCHFTIEAYHMTCSNGLTFNPITKICDWPTNSLCILSERPSYNSTNNI